MAPSANITYDLGTSTLGFGGVYLGGTSTFTTKLATGATASWTFTLPATTGVAGQGLVNSGSGTMAWKYMTADTSAKSADYTVSDTDGIRTVLMTTSSTNRTVTLPTAADNSGRIICIKKVDSGTGTVTIDGEGSETIDGATTVTLSSQYEQIEIQCDGTGWHALAGYVGKFPGDRSGSIISAGYIGEFPGTTQRAGTGGSAYTIRTTSTMSEVATDLVSVSLNKGLYTVAVSAYFKQGSGSNKGFTYKMTVGGTTVTNTINVDTCPNDTYVAVHMGPVPILITTNSTTVAFNGSFGAVASTTVSAWEMFVVRIG